MNKLTESELMQLRALCDLPDDEIDIVDIPEVTHMQNPQRGLHYYSPTLQTQASIDLD